MRYAKIVEGVVEKIGECPRSTERISNFYLLPDSEKIQYGYYPVVEFPTPAQDYQDIDNISYVINADNVEEIITYKDKDLQSYKDDKIAYAKQYAINFFNDKYDAIDMLSDDTQAQAKTLANTLKNKFLTYKNAVDACTTVQEVYGVPLQ